MEFREGQVVANGLRFAYLEAGAGPLALCLHGFPDSPWTYRYLLPRLADAGYRAVAPFMRGYAPTAVPPDGRYGLTVLADDAIALHEVLAGDAEAVIVGHDWGAAATYGAAAREPDRWRRAVIVNIPPFAVYGRIAWRYEQIRRSFYFWFFQMQPAEAVVAADDLAFLERLWADWSPGYDAADDLVHAKDCLRAPENLRAALGYYRAVFDPTRFGTAEDAAEQEAAWGRPLPQPVLYLHGAHDGCMTLEREAMAAVPAAFGPGSEAVWVEGAGHFLLVEKPAEVNERILAFLAG